MVRKIHRLKSTTQLPSKFIRDYRIHRRQTEFNLQNTNSYSPCRYMNKILRTVFLKMIKSSFKT